MTLTVAELIERLEDIKTDPEDTYVFFCDAAFQMEEIQSVSEDSSRNIDGLNVVILG